MSYRSREATAYFYMMDTEFCATIQYEIINYGSKGSFYSPPEGPDYDIERIWLSRDEYNNEGPKWEVTGEQLWLLCGSEKINEAVICDITSD